MQSITDPQIETYREQGFIVVQDAFTPEEISKAKTALEDIITRYAFNDALSDYVPPRNQATNQAGAVFRAKDQSVFFSMEPGYQPDPTRIDEISLHIRKFFNLEYAAPIFEKIVFSHPRTQPILRTLLGDEPVLFQSMALLKPPGGVEKPWHQDNAYFSTGNPDSVIGTWIALDDATIENGCMHFLPGGHHHGPLRHHHTTDCEILPDRFDRSKAVPVPLKAGGIIFFHGNIPHQTPPNQSSQRRRALQFHYRAAGNTKVDRETYDHIFCESDGTPASCAAAQPNNI
ncbi:MAG: phytanoyl-CoA dioxygenase family protein [Kiritimatiellia bacterium]